MPVTRTDDLDVSHHLNTRLTEARDAATKLAGIDKRNDDQDVALEDALDEVVRITNARNAFDVQVRSEPLTYGPGSSHSYFVDKLASAPGSAALVPNVTPSAAKARLERSATEQSHLRVRKDQERRKAWDKLSIRADLDAIPGDAGSQFASPQYLVDRFSSVARAAGTVLNLIETVPMPADGMTIHVPRFTSASLLTSPSTEGQAEDAGYTTTSEIVEPVSSFWGTVEVSMALLQRGNIDTYLAQDLAENYVASLEGQVIDGAGTGQDILGLLNIPDITSVTYTSATPNPTEVLVKLGVLAGKTSTARKRPVSAFVMTSNTWFWLTSSVDSTGAPYDRPGVGPALASDIGSVGTLFGIATYLAEGMPTDLGSGTNQTAVLALHAPDYLLLASEPIFDCVQDVATAGGQLSVFARFRSYATFVDRYQGQGTGALTGTGLIPVTDWS